MLTLAVVQQAMRGHFFKIATSGEMRKIKLILKMATSFPPFQYNVNPLQTVVFSLHRLLDDETECWKVNMMLSSAPKNPYQSGSS